MAHPSTNRRGSRRMKSEIAVLLSILASLMILSIRPFGFRTFLNGLGHDNIFSLLLVVSAVGICIVLLQRLGLIFSDSNLEVAQ